VEKKYYSEAMEAMHESVKNLFEAGAISEAEMREFEAGCFVENTEAALETESTVKEEHYSHQTA
jgi:DNA-binding transcriptional regulator YiaG